ncbi:hypothetical protein [Sporosarcina limicola]|uniref:Lipoprotein n=1 Tax=Sporosarcina limicola TaxID=34101 RepID=A0A927MJD2_9BACL|nr:hypothetical protein [Sporosarcina limicola]MBE1555683.1 hypothetical protein [Sporosarcina limicola]
MFKKAIPLALMSGFMLTACANNGTVPKNNETPMEDRTRDWTPRVNDKQTGPNLDGLDNGRDVNGNGVNNGVINDGNTTTPRDNVIIDENTTTPNETIIEENVNQNGKNRKNR